MTGVTRWLQEPEAAVRAPGRYPESGDYAEKLGEEEGGDAVVVLVHEAVSLSARRQTEDGSGGVATSPRSP